MKRAVAALALIVTGAAAGAAPPLASLSDTFDDPASSAAWQVMEGDLQDGVAPHFDIARTTPGELTIEPGRSWWVDGTRAFAMFKPVAGDFVVSLAIRVSGKSSPNPTANWSLSGLLVRRPTNDRAKENWLAFRVGRVDDVDVFERKSTVNGRSDLVLSSARSGPVQLRIARVGRYFGFFRRYPGQRWQLHRSYWRSDLPASLLVGIDAFSGYDDTKADLVSHVDSIRFTPTKVPPKLRKAVLAGKKPERVLFPYLTR